MKKKLLACSLLLGINMASQANPITRAEARLVAQELVGINDTSTDDVPVSPYYIFSRGTGQGFVIVSGDDSTAPIIGYTEHGDFDRNLLPETLLKMLDAWEERIGRVQKLRQTPPNSLRKVRARAIAAYKEGWEDVATLIKTHWHQSSPYNDLAPVKQGQGRCMTGCVATAGSQVTYYFNKDNPNELQYDTPTYSYGTPITVSLPKGTPIEWAKMKLSGSGTAEQNNAVATLMYALGTSAWLTYGDGEGTATSGHNYKMAEAMKGQFFLNSVHWEKSGSSQQQWETKIYDNLKSKRPMLYSGVHPESGGHSVVLDGYQKRTGLYHFNFGWGGQGDGYYTVDDATGMNGFNGYQDLICDITPMKQNLTGELPKDIQLYHKAPTSFQVTVKNNGTLDYQGIYVYMNTQRKVPTQASFIDQSTVIGTGKEATFEVTLTNKTAKNVVYLFLCDKNKNIIDSLRLNATLTTADLTLNSLSSDAASETQTVDGMDFRVVNNTTVNVTANMTNGEEGTFCMPSLQCFVDSYDQESKEWTRVTPSSIVSNQTFDVNETRDIVFTFSNLKADMLYRAYLNDKATATNQSTIAMPADQDSITYFMTRASDLVITSDGRTATVTGRWNDTLFRKKASDVSVCSYDFSALTQLNSQPVAANPNALFFAAGENTDWLQWDNIVVDGQCNRLMVRSDADFQAMQPFTATEATLLLADAKAGKWQGVLIPFAMDVPYGMQMKQAVGVDVRYVDYEAVRQVDPMSVVIYLTDRDDVNTLHGQQVAVIPETSVSLFDDRLQASTVTTALQSGGYVHGYDSSVFSFVAPADDQTTVAPFQPQLSGATNAVRTTRELLVEGYYAVLSETISKAYAMLNNYPEAEWGVVVTFKRSLKEAEDMFTYRTHEKYNDIQEMNNKLQTAMNNFLKGYIDEQTTAIDGMEDEGNAGHCVIYDLQGRRVSSHRSTSSTPLRKGIYIIDRKKVLVK